MWFMKHRFPSVEPYTSHRWMFPKRLWNSRQTSCRSPFPTPIRTLWTLSKSVCWREKDEMTSAIQILQVATSLWCVNACMFFSCPLSQKTGSYSKRQLCNKLSNWNCVPQNKEMPQMLMSVNAPREWVCCNKSSLLAPTQTTHTQPQTHSKFPLD